MKEFEDFSDIIKKKMDDLQGKIISGEINLLDIELVPIFNQLKESLTTYNLDRYSKTYEVACELLNQKFEELRRKLSSLNSEKKFSAFLKNNPSDEEISKLFEDCWIKIFNINSFSLDFLEESRNKLAIKKGESVQIEHLDRIDVSDDFLIEVPKQKFTEKMDQFYETLSSKVPCKFDEAFEGENDQAKIYQNFVYILHLLQSGKVKYQKDTNMLYIK